MGESFLRNRAHRRMVTLGAALLLLLSTAAATATVTVPAAAPINPLGSRGTDTGLTLAAGLAFGVQEAVVPSGDVSKLLPAGWMSRRGPVVVGTVNERVAQVSATSSYDVPQAALDAYRNAQAAVAVSDPGCHLSWTLLAGIGQVESDNGRYGGAVVLANGDISPHILGPVLNGTGGVGAIRDTDGGRYDGDAVWDRAVGPMQFIPGTWAGYGADGNGDGVSDPNNIADAALGAAHYLCAGGGDLRITTDLRAAVMSYNHSVAYVDLVLRLARAYASGDAMVIPNGQAPAAPPAGGQAAGALVRHQRTQHAGKIPGSGRQHGAGGSGSGGQGGGGGVQPPPIHTDPVHKPPVHKPPVQQPPTTTSPGRPVAVGVLDTCDTDWCVGDYTLDLGTDADLTTAQGDLNGDGKVHSVLHELLAMRGLTVTVVLDASATGGTPGDPAPSADAPDAAATDPETTTLTSGDAAPSAPSAPSAAATTSSADAAAPPLVVTVDADGLVTSINGVAYTPVG